VFLPIGVGYEGARRHKSPQDAGEIDHFEEDIEALGAEHSHAGKDGNQVKQLADARNPS
jgi:hypothetical protein